MCQRLVLLAMALAVLPAAPAAANGHAWVLTAGPAAFKRGGETYQLMIMATESRGGSDSVYITVSQTKDPAGDAKATQSHTYSWYLEGNRFVPATKLGSANVATAGEMGVYGKLDLKFTATKALQRACGGGLKTRVGRMSGTVTFKTGTPLLGTITTRPTNARLMYSDGTCDTDTSQPMGACPAPGLRLGAARFDEPPMDLFAAKGPRGPATVGWSRWGEMPKSKIGRVSHAVVAQLPRTKVVMAKDLGNATIVGVPGTWLKGEAKFVASDPAGSPFSYQCGNGKTVVNTSRSGEVKGNLKVDFWLGPDARLADGPFSGSLMKQTIRE